MKKTLAIILSVIMALSMVQTTFAAESDGVMTTLDISKGNIVIEPDSVTLNGENIEVDPDGYIITGTSTYQDTALKFYNLSGDEATFNVVFKDLKITADTWCTALTITNRYPVNLNIKCEGSNSITSYNHPVFAGNGTIDSPIVINVTRTEGSELNLEREYEPQYGIAFDDSETNNLVLNIDGEQVGADLHIHKNTDGISTCKGYLCTECDKYFGEKDETKHITDGVQTCKGYQCKNCYQFFGEADENEHRWYYGWCMLCDSKYPEDVECTHNWDDWGECVICGTECEHPSLDEGVKCTVCDYYYYAFSLTTGETVTFHETFADALDKASDGSIIKLLKDYGDYDSLGIDKAITLDLNGKEWNQPSLGSFTVNANVTFTDSVGGGYLNYALWIKSPVTLSAGSYRYVSIGYETDDTLNAYLDKCCRYYTYGDEELLDLSSKKQSEGAVTIKANHTGGTATCTQKAVCSNCSKEYGSILKHSYATEWKSDKDNHWHECSCGDKTDRAKHSGTIVNAKEATTNQKGYTGDTVCSICGFEIAKGEETPQKSTIIAPGTDNSSAQTGDGNHIVLWSALLFISGLVLVGTTYYNKPVVYNRPIGYR